MGYNFIKTNIYLNTVTTRISLLRTCRKTLGYIFFYLLLLYYYFITTVDSFFLFQTKNINFLLRNFLFLLFIYSKILKKSIYVFLNS